VARLEIAERSHSRRGGNQIPDQADIQGKIVRSQEREDEGMPEDSFNKTL